LCCHRNKAKLQASHLKLQDGGSTDLPKAGALLLEGGAAVLDSVIFAVSQT
jgi:hypothetical protein